MLNGASKRVAVLVETDDSWGREVVESIARYAHENHWTLLICPRDAQHRLRLPTRWKGDGAIVSLRDSALQRHVKAAGVPAVDVSIQMPEDRWLGRVATDDDARAAMAFEHFQSRHFEHFACYSPPLGRYSHDRALAFQRVAQKAGYSCEIFTSPRNRQVGWDGNQALVAAWLKSLPRPLAVFAADPYPARQLIEICQLEGVRIPDDIAVLSGDTDDLLCNIASPRISSVELACHKIGRSACEMLRTIMEGGPVPQQPVLIPPLRVIARHSTEILAVEDRDLAQIVQYIRDRAAEGIRVSDILRAFPISRRSLEQRFRNILGRSPAEEIRRTRLQHARKLLVETDLSVAEIATASGVCSGAQLASAFRRYLGIRPSALREGR
ncbi:Xylose operon regulatory protein [Caulifigura coniformis]|uniref:Xylose operon regulatory protein n=1 Tax=Caulifigura coniformis TaxID=2527983 RepID=A0A517SB95_9PLAN|nr:XylR family transcriptional regulator [Caulifigura coniformis]QDT53411.1 Xylose operon regulatory protein [Caulifigura coniformis]